MARTLEVVKQQDFGVTSNTSELMAAAAAALDKYMQPEFKEKALKALQDTLQSEGIAGREFARSGDGRTIGDVAELYYNGLVNGLDRGKADGTPALDRHDTPFDHKYLTESLSISAKDTAIRADAIYRTEVRDAEIAAQGTIIQEAVKTENKMPTRTLEEIALQDLKTTSDREALMASAAKAIEPYKSPELKGTVLKHLRETLESPEMQGKAFATEGDNLRNIGGVAQLYYGALANPKLREAGVDAYGWKVDDSYLTRSLEESTADSKRRVVNLMDNEQRAIAAAKSPVAEPVAPALEASATSPAKAEASVNAGAGSEPATSKNEPVVDTVAKSPSITAAELQSKIQRAEQTVNELTVSDKQALVDAMHRIDAAPDREAAFVTEVGKRQAVADLPFVAALGSVADLPPETRAYYKSTIPLDYTAPKTSEPVVATGAATTTEVKPIAKDKFESASEPTTGPGGAPKTEPVTKAPAAGEIPAPHVDLGAGAEEAARRAYEDTPSPFNKPTVGERAREYATQAGDKAKQYGGAALLKILENPKATAGVAAALTAGALLLPNKEKEVAAKDGSDTTETVKKPSLFKKVVSVVMGAIAIGAVVNAVQEHRNPISEGKEGGWVRKLAEQASQRMNRGGGIA